MLARHIRTFVPPSLLSLTGQQTPSLPSKPSKEEAIILLYLNRPRTEYRPVPSKYLKQLLNAIRGNERWT